MQMQYNRPLLHDKEVMLYYQQKQQGVYFLYGNSTLILIDELFNSLNSIIRFQVVIHSNQVYIHALHYFSKRILTSSIRDH